MQCNIPNGCRENAGRWVLETKGWRESVWLGTWHMGGELGQQLAQYIYEWLTSSIKISRRGSANNSSACLAKA